MTILGAARRASALLLVLALTSCAYTRPAPVQSAAIPLHANPPDGNGTLFVGATTDQLGRRPLTRYLVIAHNGVGHVYLSFVNGMGATRAVITTYIDFRSEQPSVAFEMPAGQSQKVVNVKVPVRGRAHDLRLLLSLAPVPAAPLARRSFGIAGRIGGAQGESAYAIAQHSCKSSPVPRTSAPTSTGGSLRWNQRTSRLVMDVGPSALHAARAITTTATTTATATTTGGIGGIAALPTRLGCLLVGGDSQVTLTMHARRGATYEVDQWSLASPAKDLIAVHGPDSVEPSNRVQVVG